MQRGGETRPDANRVVEVKIMHLSDFLNAKSSILGWVGDVTASAAGAYSAITTYSLVGFYHAVSNIPADAIMFADDYQRVISLFSGLCSLAWFVIRGIIWIAGIVKSKVNNRKLLNINK